MIEQAFTQLAPQVGVEVYSPGGPYGAVTVENFGQPGVTDYRIREAS